MPQSSLFSLQTLTEIRFYITECVPHGKGSGEKGKEKKYLAHKYIVEIRRLNYTNLNGSDNVGCI